MLRHLALSLTLAACQPATGGPRPGSCQQVVIGLDTTCANNSAGAALGESISETFLARDTLISSLTVWRVAQEDTNGIGVHLFFLGTDSTGAPDPLNVLLDGPTVVVPYGDGVHPVQFDFFFDPPFALPRAGKYAFALQANPCYGSWDLLADQDDGYPDGSLWLFSRCFCCLRLFPRNFAPADLVFAIQFCTTETASRGSTWGRLKTRYRH